jgi:hypothetical protein
LPFFENDRDTVQHADFSTFCGKTSMLYVLFLHLKPTFVLIAVRSYQVLSDHPPLSDGRFNHDKAEAREFMYCVVRGQEPEEEKREPADRIKRKRRRPYSGQVEGASPSRFSKRLAVRAKAVRSGDVAEGERLSALALPSRICCRPCNQA